MKRAVSLPSLGAVFCLIATGCGGPNDASAPPDNVSPSDELSGNAPAAPPPRTTSPMSPEAGGSVGTSPADAGGSADTMSTGAPPMQEPPSMVPPPSSMDTEPGQPGTGTGVAVAGPDGVIDLSTSECFNKPAEKIRVVAPGKYDRPLVVKGAVGETYDARGVFVKASPMTQPIQFDDPHNVCVVGASTQGQHPRSWSWSQVKSAEDHLYDGDGIGWHNPSGKFIIEGAWIDNMEDGIGPPFDFVPDTTATFSMRHVYARWIRDDFLENDGCLSGDMIDTFIDGTWTYMSGKPSKPARPFVSGSATLTVKDSLIRHVCMPDPRDKGSSCPGATNSGESFKIGPDCSLRANFDNVVILMEGMRGGNGFPPGTYNDVTLVWAGGGSLVGGKPPGATVTTSRAAWDNARAAWIKRHGCDDKIDNCKFLHHDKAQEPAPQSTKPLVLVYASPAFVPPTNGTGLQWYTENVSDCTVSGAGFNTGGKPSGTNRIRSSNSGTVMFTASCKGNDGKTYADSDRVTWIGTAADSRPPSVPADVKASAGTDGIELTWSESTDDVGVASYRIYRDGVWVTSVSGRPVWLDRAVDSGKSYKYEIEAFDAKGKLSGKSAAVTAGGS